MLSGQVELLFLELFYCILYLCCGDCDLFGWEVRYEFVYFPVM